MLRLCTVEAWGYFKPVGLPRKMSGKRTGSNLALEKLVLPARRKKPFSLSFGSPSQEGFPLMNVLFPIRSFGSRALRTPLAGLMFFLPAFAVAQTVPVTTSGVVSLTSALPPIYNGQYVLQTTDFGFLWLDTTALRGGLVEAEAKCDSGQPLSSTNIYVTGDCNGTGTVSSSGSVALVRQFNSNCGVAMAGCNGPRIRGPARLTFALGTWKYLGDGGDIPDSTQTTDPQGRTWTVQPVDTTETNFIWQSSGPPNSPPIAVASATNLSAGSRADKANYYGDKWQLQDTSSGAPTSITWDLNYTGSFAADETGTKAAEGVVTGYFPCDPSSGSPGNIRSGGNCRQSLGLGNPAAPGSYRFALQSANQFGASANTFVSAAIGVACPQA